MMPVATATFRLSAAPCMGIRTVASVAATSSGDSPFDSRPTIIALDLRQSTSRCSAEPDKSAAIVWIFRDRHQATADANDGPLQIGKRNAEPMAPRRALGENGSAVFAVAMIPVAPAASAVRMIAPTFTGLLIS